MIFAQRPDATACADYDLWNNTMRRYVRRGSKGIALIDDSGDRPRLKYVFDVSDTGGHENARQLYLWEYRPEHETSVTAALEDAYEISGEHGLADQLEKVAAQLADEYWRENQRDILHIVDDSFLEEYDEFNIGVAFRSAATVSITYALMSRCGLEPENYFDHEDFLSIFDFNTPAVVNALGTAVSQSSQQVLRQIGATIKHYEYERSQTNERTDLHPERGLSDSQLDLGGTGRGKAPGQVRQNEEELSEGASDGALQQPPADREADRTSSGDGRDSEPALGADDAGTGKGGGRDREPESQRTDAVGGPDEQLQGPGRGNDLDGTYIQLTLPLFLSEQEQIKAIDEAESRQPSAFSMPQADTAAQPEPEQPALEVSEQTPAPETSATEAARPVDTQTAIDDAIREWNGDITSKQAVIWYMKDHARDKGTAAWLKQEYGDELPALPVPGAATDLSWPKVQRRIAQLIKEDRFLTEKEKQEPSIIGMVVEDSNTSYEVIGIDYDEDIGTLAVLQDMNSPADAPKRTVEPLEYVKALIQHPAPPEHTNEPTSKAETPTVREVYEQYLPVIRGLVLEDVAYQNACKNSDKENAYLEGNAAIKRAVSTIENAGFINLYYGLSSFHNNLHRDVLEATYPELSAVPSVPDLSDQPVTREGDTITIGNGPATHEIDITVSDEEWQQIQEAIPEEKVPARDPLALAYQVGDTVYLDDKPFVIENIGTYDVQLRDPSLHYPVFRAESAERFEILLRQDSRNGSITEFLSTDPEKADADLREVLTSGLFTFRDKAYISGWLASGEGNTRIAQRLSETFAGRAETMELITGETADYFISTTGVEIEIQDKYNSRRSMSWNEIAPMLRGLFFDELDGFNHDPKQCLRYVVEQTSDAFDEPFIILDQQTGEFFDVGDVYQTFETIEEAQEYAARLNQSNLEGVPVYQVGDKVTLPLSDREISGTIGYIGENDVRIDTGPYAWSHETFNGSILKTIFARMSEMRICSIRASRKIHSRKSQQRQRRSIRETKTACPMTLWWSGCISRNRSLTRRSRTLFG